MFWADMYLGQGNITQEAFPLHLKTELSGHVQTPLVLPSLYALLLGPTEASPELANTVFAYVILFLP